MKLVLINCVHANREPARKISCAAGQFKGSPVPRMCATECRHRVARDAGGPSVEISQFIPPLVESSRKPYDGSREWEVLHAIRDLDELRNFVDELAKRLPCGDCKRDFIAFLELHPVDGDAFEWGIAAHNHVNRKLGNREWSIDEARRHYIEDLQPCDWCGRSADIRKGEHCQLEMTQFICGKPLCPACDKRFGYCKRHVSERTGSILTDAGG